MKRIKNFIAAGCVALAVTGCDFIDIVPDGIPDIETHAFAMRSQAEKFLFTCYAFIPMNGTPARVPQFMAGHEIVITSVSRSYSGNQAYYIQRGQQRSSNPYLDFWRGTSSATGLYKGINTCNVFIENIDHVPDMTAQEKSMWKDEAEFLKVYYHFWLVRMYGPIPIMDKNIPVSAPESEMKVFRNTLDECFDYLLTKLDTIIAHSNGTFGLMTDYSGYEAERTGRITKSVAMFMRAKVALWAASPLYNGSSIYKGYVDKRGTDIFSAEKSSEAKAQRWADAERYCAEALTWAEGKGYGLYTYVPSGGPNEIPYEPTTIKKLSIRGSVTQPLNREIIWADVNNWVGVSGFGYGDVQNQAHPRDLIEARKTSNANHRGNFAVPLKIARQFYTKNGLPIDRDKAWDNVDRYAVAPTSSRGDTTIRCLLAEGYVTAEFNRNREIRYYASLGFDGGVWVGQGDNSDHTQYLKGRQGDPAANTIDNSWNLTGIFPKKLLNPNTVFGGADGAITTSCTAERYPWPLMRFNDLVLMYAEALCETGKLNEAKVQLNRIRERASIPPVDEAYTQYSNTPRRPASQQGLREIIREERLVELALEGYRYYDLLRWQWAAGEAPDYLGDICSLASPITGWTLSGKEPKAYYREAMASDAPSTFVSPRDYFSPIPSEEILRNSNIKQNPGW